MDHFYFFLLFLSSQYAFPFSPHHFFNLVPTVFPPVFSTPSNLSASHSCAVTFFSPHRKQPSAGQDHSLHFSQPKPQVQVCLFSVFCRQPGGDVTIHCCDFKCYSCSLSLEKYALHFISLMNGRERERESNDVEEEKHPFRSAVVGYVEEV